MRSPVGSWPSDSYIMSHYDKSELSYNQVKYLNLDKGNWYVTVYAYSGFGQFELDGSKHMLEPGSSDRSLLWQSKLWRNKLCPGSNRSQDRVSELR